MRKSANGLRQWFSWASIFKVLSLRWSSIDCCSSSSLENDLSVPYSFFKKLASTNDFENSILRKYNNLFLWSYCDVRNWVVTWLQAMTAAFTISPKVRGETPSVFPTYPVIPTSQIYLGKIGYIQLLWVLWDAFRAKSGMCLHQSYKNVRKKRAWADFVEYFNLVAYNKRYLLMTSIWRNDFKSTQRLLRK